MVEVQEFGFKRSSNRLTTPVLDNARVQIPRVVVRRESLWSYPAPTSHGRPDITVFPPGRLLASWLTVYGAAGTVQEFEDSTVPVLAALRENKSHVAAGFVVQPESMHLGFLRYCVERCHGLDASSFVELGGMWNSAALEVLGTVRPRYLRVGPEHVHGVHGLPELQQSLTHLSQFSESLGVPLVARGVQSKEERAALRQAGVVLFSVTESGAPGTDPLVDLESLGTAAPPTVLTFPLRPLGR